MACGRRLCFAVPRGRCPQCRRLHTGLPVLATPYKHYETKVIQDVMDGKGDTCVSEDSTMRRWRAEFRRVAPYIETLLQKVLKMREQAYPLFGEPLLDILRRKIPQDWAASVLPLLTVHHFFPATQFACQPGG